MSENLNNVAETEQLKELLEEQKLENAVVKEKIAQLQNKTTVIWMLKEELSKTGIIMMIKKT